MDWDRYFLDGALWVATKSKDQSTKCGCIIVSSTHEILSTGFNGMPRGCPYDKDPERNARPLKYTWYEHAERNALYNAARIGVNILGATLYVTGPPCVDCGRGIASAGIKRVVWDINNPFETIPATWERWKESCEKAQEVMSSCGVEIVRYK